MERTKSAARKLSHGMLAAIVVASPSALPSASPSYGAVLTWNGSGLQNWNTPAAWLGTPTNATQWPDASTEDAVINIGAQVNVNANYVIGKLDLQGGLLTGSGTINANGRLTYTGGTLAGTGTLQANAGFDISGAAAMVLDGRSIASLANSTWSSGTLRIDSNTSIANAFDGATLTLGAVGVDPASVGTLTLFNGGTLRYNSVSSTTLAKTSLENGRLLKIDAGSLSVAGGVNFDDVTIAGGSELAFDTAFRLHGGSGTGDSVISGASAGTSVVTNRSGAILTVSNNAAGSVFITSLKDVTLENLGTISVPANDVLSTTGTGVIRNGGVLTFAGSGGLNTAAVSPTGPGAGLINDGVLRLTSTAGTVLSYMPITNSATGQIQIQGGTLDVRTNATLNGLIDIDAGATLQLASTTPVTALASLTVDGALHVRNGYYIFESPGAITGNGVVRASGSGGSNQGVIQLDGAASGAGLTVDAQNSGAIVLNGTLAPVAVANVQVAGLGDVSVAGTVNAQHVTSFGMLSVAIGGDFEAASVAVSGTTLVGGTLHSLAGLSNTGQMVLNPAGAKASAVDDFDNQGDLYLEPGTTVSAGAMVANGGTIYGTGSLIAATLASSGAIAPGMGTDVGIGTIVIDADLLLDTFHLLRMEVDATSLSSDQLSVAGDVVLGGYLDIVHIIGDASVILPTDEFTLLQGSSLSGAFADDGLIGGPVAGRVDAYDDLSNLGSFQVVVDEQNARVYLTNFAPVPEPGVFALFGILGAVFGRRTARR
jgi:hypothetical protein